MKKAMLLGGTFSAGILTNAIQPYASAFYKQYSNPDDDHSFNDFIQEKGFTQPKIIDFLHSSPDRHFLHNMIVQHDEAMNVFKIYYPNKLEQKIFNGNAKEDPHKLHLHLVFNASEHLQGHQDVVHGGLLATLIDNAFGQLTILASGLNPTATANLKVDYKRPVHTNQDYMITCEVDKIEGRKVYVKATIFDKDHNVCTEASALFLTVNWGVPMKWKQILNKLGTKSNSNQSNTAIQQ